MALIDIEKTFSFLKDVELKELKNKNKNESILKTIKFNKDEYILLQYITYLNKNFGTYIKQLIEMDIENNLGDMKTSINNLDEEYLMTLIEKVLEKKNVNMEKAEPPKEGNKNKEMLDDLKALNINRR